MEKIELRGNNLLKGNGNIWKFIIQQIMLIVVGGVLYFILSWLSFNYFQPGISNVTFRPATAILALFGILYGPWVGLFAGIFGKTLIDYVAGWGFYWNGILAYGLIGFIPGFMQVALKDLRSTRNILRAVVFGGVGVFASALFLSITEIFFGDINFEVALRNYFWAELAGNLTVVIIFLPLLIVAFVAIDRNRNK